MMNYKTISVQGTSIFYREAGNPEAPAIVLLHGFPTSSHMFRDLMPLLATRFHVIAPDYPGFGYSDEPQPESFQYTFDNLSLVIEEFLAALGVESYSLYLQDYGGPIGFRLATRHPERVQSLILQNANAYKEGISAAMEMLNLYWTDRAMSETAVRGLLTRATTVYQYTHGAHRPERISPDAYHHAQALLDRPGNDRIQLELLFDYQHNVELYPQWQEYLRQHQPPTLILWGENDPFFLPAGARAYQQDLPNAELHLLPGGHFVLEEAHEEIAQLIHDFLSA
jgi:pimeloyl-ACP methyl ester carboxylesterase